MDHASLIAQIEAAESERIAATLARDIPTLERVLGEDLIYVHSSGASESRALYLERLAQRYYDYQSLTPLTRQYRVYPDMVLVNGDVRIEVIARGTPKLIMSRFCQAWARRDGRWQMVTWHSTPMPAA